MSPLLLLLACTPDLVDYKPVEREDWSYADGFLIEVDADACSVPPDVEGVFQPGVQARILNRLDTPVELTGISYDCSAFALEDVAADGEYNQSGLPGEVFQVFIDGVFHSAWQFDPAFSSGGGTVVLQ